MKSKKTSALPESIDANYEKLIKLIKIGEGFDGSAYQDSLGYWTIGYGHLVDKRLNGKISEAVAESILINDINDCFIELQGIAWFVIQDEVRQQVLVELAFNMGLPHLLDFKDMIGFLKNRNYQDATKALLDSEWAKQIQPSRVESIRDRLLTGQYD